MERAGGETEIQAEKLIIRMTLDEAGNRRQVGAMNR